MRKFDYKSCAAFPKKMNLVTFPDLLDLRDLILTLARAKCDTCARYPFEATLAELRAKAIDIAGPRLHHTETSKFDL